MAKAPQTPAEGPEQQAGLGLDQGATPAAAERIAQARAARQSERATQPQVRRGEDGRVEVVLSDGTVLRRNRSGAADSFYVPPDIIPDGWTYQWNVATVTGRPDVAAMTNAMENGWRPVPAKRHPGIFMPADHEGAIERDGLMLMERPEILTQEAQEEERGKANGLINMQKEAIGQALPPGFNNQHRKVAPTIRTNYERSPVERPALQIADDSVV